MTPFATWATAPSPDELDLLRLLSKVVVGCAFGCPGALTFVAMFLEIRDWLKARRKAEDGKKGGE